MAEQGVQGVETARGAATLAFIEQQRAALAEVGKLAAEVVAREEEEIERRYRETIEADQAEYDEVAERIRGRWQKKIDAVEREYAEKMETIEREYAAARASLAAQTEKLTRAALAEFAEAQKEARHKEEDDLLMADTVAHATIQGIQKEYRATVHRTQADRRRIDELRQRVETLLGQYGVDRRRLPEAPAPPADSGGSFEQALQRADEHLAALRALTVPHVLAGGRAAALLAVVCALPVAVLGVFHFMGDLPALPLVVAGGAAVVVFFVADAVAGRMLRRRALVRAATRCAAFDAAAQAAGEALDERLRQAEQKRDAEEQRATDKHQRDRSVAEATCRQAICQANRQRLDALERIEKARAARAAENARRYEEFVAGARHEHEARLAEYARGREQELAAARARFEKRTASCRAEYQAARREMETRWHDGIAAVRRMLEMQAALGPAAGFDWVGGPADAWRPPETFADHVVLGRWRVDLRPISPSVRKLTGFPPAELTEIETPLLLALPQRCSLLLQSDRAGRREALDVLRSVMLRLLTSLPPGRVQFTIIDPVGLGENFAGFMHLGDYEEALVGARIWTETTQIEARLTELTAHMENVIQKYLRNEFETIDEYNRQAGEMAEPYRFLVIADFPANFSDEAARRLSSIISSGPRCGVFTLIAHDRRLAVPPALQLDDLEAASVRLVWEPEQGGFVCHDELLRPYPLVLDAPPDEDTLTQIMHTVGRAAQDSLRVEVPFATAAPADGQLWSRSSAEGLSVPLGRAGAVRLQSLRLGKGLAQHVLVAGKTGSGKSTLLHVIITNTALWYGPDEVEFYLVDFKKGVEFKTYVTHELPHARAIAIESDREFGVSVLQRIDAEMHRRGELFRAAGVQDLPAYRAVTGEKLPRTLLIVDEFQVFFTEDDKLAQDAAILLDRLVRQGRAFGIHVLLGSQTLGGAASLARSTMGQMAVRIALHCSEADSQLILDDTNVAARLLSRPGEAIYNDAGGLAEGNSPFQTAWLPDAQRIAYLRAVQSLARRRGVEAEPPIVFEGSVPADISRNRILADVLAQPRWSAPPPSPRVWLGEAVAIKEPTSLAFSRQAGANLLIVGQRDDAAGALFAATLVALASQVAPSDARFVIFDGGAGEPRAGEGLQRLANAVPHEVRLVGWRDVGETIVALGEEMRRRLEADRGGAAPRVFLLVYGLQRYRMLRRRDDDFSFSVAEERPPAPDRVFGELLRDGPPVGIHTVVWADTLATLERTLDRQTIGEFDHRVLFQVGAADSSNLIDTPEANKLGFHRALLYSEESGTIEKFRPYGPCDADWLAEVARRLKART